MDRVLGRIPWIIVCEGTIGHEWIRHKGLIGCEETIKHEGMIGHEGTIRHVETIGCEGTIKDKGIEDQTIETSFCQSPSPFF